MQESVIRTEKLQQEMVEAVTAAREKVYAKAKLQFEAGNKEFQKVKGLLKESKTEKELIEKQVEQVSNQLNEVKMLLDNEKMKVVGCNARTIEVRGLLMTILQSVNEAYLPFNAGGTTTTNEVNTKKSNTNVTNTFVLKDDYATEQLAVTAAQKTLLSFSNDLQEALRNKQSLQAAVSVIEGSLQRLENQLTLANNTIASDRGNNGISLCFSCLYVLT